MDLLKEYISILVEDDYGDLGVHDASSNFGPYGGTGPYGSDDKIANIFIAPFKNLLGVIAGETKKLSVKTQDLLKATYKNIIGIFDSSVENNYQEIRNEQKKELDKINKEYGGVYDKAFAAFKHDDVLVGAFWYRPDLFLTKKYIENAPTQTMKLFDILTGGKYADQIEKYTNRIENELSKKKPEKPTKPTKEKPAKEKETTSYRRLAATEALRMLIDDPKVQNDLKNSKFVKQVNKAYIQTILSELTKIDIICKKTVESKNIEQLLKANKSDQEVMNDINDSIKEISNEMGQEAAQEAKQEILKTSKLTVLTGWQKLINNKIEYAKEKGLNEEHSYLEKFIHLETKIKSYIELVKRQ